METKDPYVTNSSSLLRHNQIITKSQPLRYTFPGIYFLIRDNHVVYVGQSVSNVLVRIAQHTLDKEFDSFTVITVDESLDLNTLEAAYIYQLEPQYNNGMPRNSRFLSKGGLKTHLGLTGHQINRNIKDRHLHPRFGQYYDIEDFK